MKLFIDTNNMGARALRIQFNIIALSLPYIFLIRQKVMRHIRLIFIDAQLFKRQFQPSCLYVARIEINDNDYDIRIIARSFVVRKQLVIFYLAKPYVARHLEGRVFTADRIKARKEIFNVARRIPVPALDLVLLGIKILFLALDRRVDAKLERRPVDTVIRREGRRHHCAHSERRPSPVLQMLGEDVGRVRPEVRTEKFCRLGLRKFGQIFLELLFCTAPGEIRIRLAEAASPGGTLLSAG